MSDKILDKLGNEIKPGCYIVYGHALGRCAGLRMGKVLAVATKPPPYGIILGYKITVWGVDDDWSYSNRQPQLLSKKSTLQFPDRMIVLDHSMIPKNIMELFDSIKDSA